TLQTRLGGHLVAGHVNTTGEIAGIISRGDNWLYRVKLKSELMKYCINEGSISIDGVSLTIAEIQGNEIRISLISHTKQNTIFQYYKTGDKVNIEVDLIAKYLESLLKSGNGNSPGSLDVNLLKKWGY
ncbi:MAG: riboflavin synthase, partial [Calditrichia bacterium]|nr:riboflavin synthase [Calditrichia bacterium]